MKKLNLSLILALGLLCPAVIVTTASLTGCSSTQQGTTLKTLTAVHVATDNTYKSYLDYAYSHPSADSGIPPASKAYREFQAAYNLALTAVAFNTNAPAPQSVLDAAAKVSTTVKSVK